jgi:hypothetical protein
MRWPSRKTLENARLGFPQVVQFDGLPLGPAFAKCLPGSGQGARKLIWSGAVEFS